MPSSGAAQFTKPAARKATEQRIKMRMVGNPVKMDGKVTEYASDGGSFTVTFDGPFPDTTFYPWRENTVTTHPVKPGGEGPALIPGCQIWEVL